MNKETIKIWLKSNENKLLVLLMLFTIIMGLYYFFKLGNQPIWWDEGDYLAIAKVWAIGMSQPEWWSHFTGMRPLLMPVVWFLFMKIGLGELAMRFFSILVPSILTVYLVYAVGRDLYNKKVGLIAGFIMSSYWVFLFYSFRLLTDIPALFLGMLTIYFFWSVYIKRKKNYGLYLAVVFGVLAFTARFPLALVLAFCFLYLLFIKKKEFFKDKTIWKALAFLVLCLLPYIIYFIYSNFYLFQFYSGEASIAAKIMPAFSIFQMFPMLFEIVFFILLLFGLIFFFRFILNLDLFFYQKDEKFNSDFFILLWIIVHLMFYVFLIRAANDRWLLMLMPALFYVISRGLVEMYGFAKKYSNYFAVFLIFTLLLAGGYFQLNHANQLINIKKDTYKEVMLAGLWLKENTPIDAKIMTASIVQNQYYSERQTYSFYVNGTYTDKKLVEEKIQNLKPDYFIVSIFEPAFTPEWVYSYPQENNLTAVQAYTSTKEYEKIYNVPEGTPLLIIYKF